MKITTEYSDFDLHKGKCLSCGRKTLILNEGILTENYDNKCPNCIEDDKFYKMTSDKPC